MLLRMHSTAKLTRSSTRQLYKSSDLWYHVAADKRRVAKCDRMHWLIDCGAMSSVWRNRVCKWIVTRTDQNGQVWKIRASNRYTCNEYLARVCWSDCWSTEQVARTAWFLKQHSVYLRSGLITTHFNRLRHDIIRPANRPQFDSKGYRSYSIFADFDRQIISWGRREGLSRS
jgi:hypothetical protein